MTHYWGRIGPYAFLCKACNHRVVLHVSGGEPPFHCKLCGCQIDRDSPMRGLTKRQYEAYRLKHPEDIAVGGDPL